MRIIRIPFLIAFSDCISVVPGNAGPDMRAILRAMPRSASRLRDLPHVIPSQRHRIWQPGAGIVVTQNCDDEDVTAAVARAMQSAAIEPIAVPAVSLSS
ncbi:hypothetical protein [Pseudorhodoplanes sp.]|uniref:hypothetical protein n=1 Tax=Pseudorhodoplanes sp. TaxID=1934341 RepID=UPI00391CC059